MTQEAVEKIVEVRISTDTIAQIHFKKRALLNCYFVKAYDYDEMKAKNFWRVVEDVNIEEYHATKNILLTRLFNGLSFTKISSVK